MSQVARLILLLLACAALWGAEARWSVAADGNDRARHARPNLVLAFLAIVTNLVLAQALSPLWRDASVWNRRWPLWLQAVAGVALLDLCGWLSHFLLHKVPWGWRVHRVHHSDVAVDVTTAFRQHPVETAWRVGWRVLPVSALGIPIPIAALYETLSALNALFEHANLALPARVDRILRWLVVTPNMHKWHHSRDARETDTNYGNVFSAWDRLFGTWTDPAPLVGLRYGLVGFDGPAAQSVGGVLRMPLDR